MLGGSGSSGGDTKGSADIYSSLLEAGFNVNPTLKKFYENNSQSGKGRDANPSMGSTTTGLAIGETPYENYTDDVIDSYADYNDAALIVISRIGGEGFDLPRTMVTEYGGALVEGAKEGQHYLELDGNEEKLIEEVCNAGFGKVIVLINCSTSMELGFIEDNSKIDAALWIGSPGGTGINALGEILSGDKNPSGRLVDTYVRDFTQDPTFQNFSDNMSTNGNAYLQGGSYSGYHYVEYEEGIYFGYRYYETKAYQEVERFGDDNGFYKESVIYPFGYGLSYSQFEWEVLAQETTEQGIISDKNAEITVKVKVTNRGVHAGKDVVQLYYSAPYYNGGIEKAHVVLGDYVKTQEIESGESDVVELKISMKDMASYDYSDANGNGFKGYETEIGLYTLYIGKNAHQTWQYDNELVLSYYANETFTYEMDTDGTADGDDNRFDDVSSHFKSNETSQAQASLMSRTAFSATFPSRPNISDREAKSDMINALNFVYNDAEASYYVKEEDKPIQGKTTGQPPQLYELIKYDGDGNAYVDYNDPLWEELLDYITVDEMVYLIGSGNFNTARIDSIGKPSTIDPDGPAGFTNFMGDPSVHDTCFYASECVIGATWNKDLAYDMGVMVGIEGQTGYTRGDSRPYSGWYAPAINIHRSPFSGRNWEYYSEDPYLAGAMGAHVVAGAKSKGVYTYVKHFAVNDQETNRDTNGLITWLDEQTLREIYLKPFQMVVEDGKTTAMMSSFNRIGTTWAGGSYALLTNVLREEWGFKGMVVTDYNVNNAYMPPNQMIRAGGDIVLCQAYFPSSSGNISGISEATQIQLLRNATKNILYTVVNSCAMNGIGEGVVYDYAMPYWQIGLIVFNVVLFIGFTLWGVLTICYKMKKIKSKTK